MTRSKYLNPQEKKFAELVANNVDHTPPHVLAYQAGFNGTIDNVMTKASFLLKNDKVSKLIATLREERYSKISNDFYNKMKKFNELFDKIIIQTNRELKDGRTHKAITLLKNTKSITNFFSDTLYKLHKPIKVYLAEETRPYSTGHFKIGMTTQEDIQSRKTYTDNPYEVNYICYFDYLPNYGFDLERTLHKFFRNYSTNNFKDTGSKEWFLLRNRKAVLKAFYKASVICLNDNKCKHNFVRCDESK